MIDPIMPPAGPPPQPLGPPPEDAPLITPQDVLSSAGVSHENLLDLLFGPNGQPALPPASGLSIIEFTRIVNDAILELDETLHETDLQEALMFRELHQSVANRASFLIELRSLIREVAEDSIALVETQNTQIMAHDLPVQAHNSQVSNDITEVNKMNKAITKFNNGMISESSYTNIANNYNNYRTGRNSNVQSFNTTVNTFNTQVAANNVVTTDLNIRRVEIGLEELPPQETSESGDLLGLAQIPPTVGMPPVPEVSKVTELVEIPEQPTAQQLLNTLYRPLIEILILLFSLIETGFISTIEGDIENDLFFFRGIQPALPNSFIANQPDTFFSTTEGTAAGPAVTGTNLNLDSPNLEGLLSNALFDAINVINKQALDSGSIDEINIQILQSVIDLALLSSLSAAVLLGNQFALLGNDSPAITAAISLTLAARLQDLVSTNIFRNSTINLLRRNLGLGASFGRINGLADAFTAGVNLALLQLSLSRVALTLGIPGLAPQLLGNVSGLRTVDILLASTAGSRLNEVLRSPLSILFLKDTLSGQLASVSALNTAQSLVNLAINNVLAQGTFQNNTALRESLVGEFKAQGLGSFQSLALANAAVALINGDVNALFLDTAFIASSVNRGAVGEALINRLVEQGFDVGTAGTAVNAALERTLSQDFETKRESRDQFASELVAGGLGRTNAIALANDAVEFLERGAITPFSADQIRQDILGASLTNVLTGRGLGAGAADTTVDNILAGVLSGGPYGGAGGFRNAIREGFQAAGFGPALSRELADAAVIQFDERLGNPLLSLGATSILDLGSISDLLRNEVEGQLGSVIGATDARKLADQFVDLVTNRDNENSFINLIERERKKLESSGDNRALEAFDRSLRDFVHMSPDTQRFLRRTEELGLTALSVPAQTAQGTGGPDVPVSIMPV